MLIIGHRGARGLQPENTLPGFVTALELGVDMIEFDIRLTRDNVPVLSHDGLMLRLHGSPHFISSFTLTELRQRTSGTPHQIVTLEEVLKLCAGKVLLNVELKQRHAFKYALPYIEKYIKKRTDWELYLFSSFLPGELSRARQLADEAQLALLHRFNPLLFLRYARGLRLTAVGFHRLHVNQFTITLAQKFDLFTYAYTVNRPAAAERLARLGVDGVVTDRPDVFDTTQ